MARRSRSTPARRRIRRRVLAVLLAGTTAAARPDVTAAARATALPFRWLGGTSRAETWGTAEAAGRVSGRARGAHVAEGPDFQFGHLVMPMPAAAIEAVTETAYREVLAAGLAGGYPHLLRVWNYFGGINDGAGDRECYRRFCVGRARAIPTEPATGYAAATAIGIPGPCAELHLSWLAARRPGVPIENPRQVSAWEYPGTTARSPPAFRAPCCSSGTTRRCCSCPAPRAWSATRAGMPRRWRSSTRHC